MIEITSNIDKVIAQLKSYRKSLERKMSEIIKELCSQGATICRSEIIALDAVFTGELANSVVSYYDEASKTGLIVCEADYGIYVEFGTGIIGKEHPYIGTAMADVGYKYGGGTTYVQLKDGRVGWYYPADDGTWKFTEGQLSRPFMYNTAQILKRQVIPIARTVMSR